MKRALLLALLLAPPLAPAARAQPADPAWLPAWDYLVQTVCTDAQDRPLPGVTPLDTCPRPRKIRAGELLPYHKRDWPGLADRLRHPDGYQQSDAVPVRTALGPAVMHTYDFGDTGRGFERFDDGDGGQLLFLTPRTVAVGVTEDGGAGLQLFLGPDCRPLDSWVVVDRSFPRPPEGQLVAQITRRADRCADRRLNQAFTAWHLAPVTYRTGRRGRVGTATWSTLLTEHYDDAAPTAARAMERMYFTHELGYTRWEAWHGPASRTLARDRSQAEILGSSERCPAAAPAPGPGWLLVDCREWTQLTDPADPAGDPPFIWLDRLRTAPATAALFDGVPAR